MRSNTLRKLSQISLNPSKLQLKMLTLAFKDESGVLENEFLEDYYQKYAGQVRISLFIAIVFYSLFGILLWYRGHYPFRGCKYPVEKLYYPLCAKLKIPNGLLQIGGVKHLTTTTSHSA